MQLVDLQNNEKIITTKLYLATCVYVMFTVLIVHSTGLLSTMTEPTSKKMRTSSIDVQPCVVYVRRLKSRYLRQLPTAKTDWPKHKVTQYVRLALVEKDDVTLKDTLNDITKLTLQGNVDRILKKKQPLRDLREIFHYQDEPCPRLIVIMGGPGEH